MKSNYKCQIVDTSVSKVLVRDPFQNKIPKDLDDVRDFNNQLFFLEWCSVFPEQLSDQHVPRVDKS